MLDYLIIGHGLAGAVLSHELLSAGKKVMVLNDPSLNSASRVAGGLYNPITGRKMVKTWNADKIFPVIEPFYSSLEEKLGTRFLYNIGIYRPFLSIEEQNEWQGKVSDYAPYVGHIYTSSREEYSINDKFGGLHLKNAGYVDTKSLLSANKKYLLDKGSYRELMFKDRQLEQANGRMKYADLEFNRLIFCNGYNYVDNPWFSWLPFRPVKGEILTAELEIEAETILNRGIFILPVSDGKSRIGSTYNWKEINNEPSDEGRKEIEEKLKNLYNGEYRIESVDAGIRPATKDRRPFIGLHPENRQVGIFNGFGSKGVSLIPYYARNFVDSLECDGELDEEVNICRYFSLY